MTCPCHNCLIYIRCQQKVKKTTVNRGAEVFYEFDELIKECDALRKFFGLDTLEQRIRIKNHQMFSFVYDKTLLSHITDQPRGRDLLEEFLKVMHVEKMPNAVNPKIRVKGPHR